jgi:hypothetical protein
MTQKSLADGWDNTAGYNTFSAYLTPTSSGVQYPEYTDSIDGENQPFGAAFMVWTWAPLSDADYTLLLGYAGFTLNTPSITSVAVTVDGRFVNGLWRGVQITFRRLEVV